MMLPPPQPAALRPQPSSQRQVPVAEKQPWSQMYQASSPVSVDPSSEPFSFSAGLTQVPSLEIRCDSVNRVLERRRPLQPTHRDLHSAGTRSISDLRFANG
ncbi:hypothetical protein WMY93_000166 [Mugilogobius chulae]|uniref:Uncharacterized protein n=1 Tax=Mugilogobius chulae TaxID=88201 RepID=A0AAW0PZI3_9GOBI